jgi:Holliday junction DNA helicase RuvA
MIAHLRGVLSATDLDHAVIDVGGVGYLVGASSRTLSAIGPVGEPVMLHTEMLVAEDFIRLVGFASASERDWFRLLTGVQGVGARVALAILSALEPTDLVAPVGAGADAVSALLNLGFRPAEASSAVAAAEEELGTGATLDALVRLALRKAAK